MSEVAAYLRKTEKAIYAMVGRGQLPCIRIGRALLFSRESLVEWLRHKSSAVTTEKAV